MNVGRIGNAGIGHGAAHAGGHLFDLTPAAQLLERQRRRMRPPDRERGRSPTLALPALEHDPVRRHAAFGAARHDKTNGVRGLGRQMTAEQQIQMRGGKAAAEVVDQPIAFGLAEHGDDAGWNDTTIGNRGFDTADVVGGGSGNTVDLGDGHVCHAQ